MNGWPQRPVTYPSPLFTQATLVGGDATSNLLAVPLQQLHVISVLDYGAKGDGITDDTAVIQSTLNNFAGNAAVLIPNTGSAFMVGPLYLPSNTDLIVNGTVKLTAGQMAAPINILTGISNVHISGYGTIDGNGTAQADKSATIYVNQATNVVIEGITAQNAAAWNLNVVASSHVRINRVYLLGGVNSNEFAQGCDDCMITNSLIDGVSDDGGFTFYGGVTNSKIISCTVRNQPLATGIGVYCDVAQPVACSQITIADNICYNIGWGGIAVSRDNTVTAVHTNIIISGNRCYANNTANVTYADIWVSTGAGVVVSGNMLGGSGHGSSPTWGVFVGANSALVSITGNTIYDEGMGGSQGSGVYIQAAPDVLVSGNVISDNQATKSMQSAITGNAGARNVIGANEFGTFIGAANQLVMATDTTTLTGSLVVPGVTSVNLPITAMGTGTTSPSLEVKTTGNGTDQNIWDAVADGTLFLMRAVNDAQTLASSWVQVTRGSGYSISAITFFSSSMGFFGTTPAAKQTVTGSKGGDPVLTSLMAALSSYGLVTDNTT